MPRITNKRECPVCTKSIGKTANSVVCPSCEYETCPKCTKVYLSSIPHGILQCMNCHIKFTDEFVISNLGVTFMNKEYRKLREESLLTQEKEYLPQTIPFLALDEQRRAMEHRLGEMAHEKQRRQAELTELNMDMVKLKDLMDTLQHDILTADSAAIIGADYNQGQSGALRPSSCSCKSPNCAGQMTYIDGVDSTMSCGACKSTACVHCHEILTLEGAGASEMHECDPATVETVKEIARSSRPCPTCHVPIQRSEGCSQMFCTKCHTAFDYNTGEVEERGNIHNPVFFEWLETNREAARAFEEGRITDYIAAEQEGGGANDQTCEPPSTNKIMQRITDIGKQRRTLKYLRDALHIRAEARTLARQLAAAANRDVYNRDLRINFLKQEIDEREFKRELYMREKGNNKRVNLNQLYEMFSQVSMDMLHRLLRPRQTDADIDRILGEMVQLRAYFNKHSRDLSRRYGSKTEILTE